MGGRRMNSLSNRRARGKKTLRQKTSKFSQSNASGSGQPNYNQLPLGVNLSRFNAQPPSIFVKLRYNIQQHLLNGALPSASYGYNCNGLYDVDPALASTAIPGFTEWMSLYRAYQVTTARACVTVTSNCVEGQEVDFTWISQTIAANLYTPANYGNQYSTTKCISAVGGLDRVSYNKTVNMAQINGTSAYWGTVSNFQGTQFTNPATVYQFQVGISGLSGAVPADAYLTGYLEFVVHLSSPTVLSF
jgi:hypothetical protein